ncbi:hypothetical protein PG990_013749 [Apiospora arundinis]
MNNNKKETKEDTGKVTHAAALRKNHTLWPPLTTKAAHCTSHWADTMSASAAAATTIDTSQPGIAPVSDLELLLSRLILDEEHDTPDYDTTYDDNI